MPTPMMHIAIAKKAITFLPILYALFLASIIPKVLYS